LNFQWLIGPSSIYVAKQQRTKWNHQNNICLTFQWLCLTLYLHKQFLGLGQNLPLSYSLLYQFEFSLCYLLNIYFIEILDKLITYIVWWYNTLYRVSPVAYTTRITKSSTFRLVVILVHAKSLTWYKVLYKHTMNVMGMYRGDQFE
jgi:hypothetical protein